MPGTLRIGSPFSPWSYLNRRPLTASLNLPSANGGNFNFRCGTSFISALLAKGFAASGKRPIFTDDKPRVSTVSESGAGSRKSDWRPSEGVTALRLLLGRRFWPPIDSVEQAHNRAIIALASKLSNKKLPNWRVIKKGTQDRGSTKSVP